VKATPAFNLALCTRFASSRSSSTAQRLDLPSLRRGRAPPHEYLRDRGRYADVPVEEIQQRSRGLSEVLPPRTRRSEGNVRAELMRALLEESFSRAVAAADPLRILAPHLPPPPRAAPSWLPRARPRLRWPSPPKELVF